MTTRCKTGTIKVLFWDYFVASRIFFAARQNDTPETSQHHTRAYQTAGCSLSKPLYSYQTVHAQGDLLSSLIKQNILFKFTGAGAIFSSLFVPASKITENFLFTLPAKSYARSLTLNDLPTFFTITLRGFLLVHEINHSLHVSADFGFVTNP